MEYKVCVITVTYGNRWEFLEAVLKRILTFDNVSHVVLVNNACQYSINTAIGNLADKRIHLINENENRGSAGGYKIGIEYASQLDSNFLWLLDDDNLPDNNCLDSLLRKWTSISGVENRKALFCLREDRKQHIKIAQGENPYRFYLVPNNFLGFSIFRIFVNQFKKLGDWYKRPRILKDVQIPFAPYGGLLLHKSILSDIGVPDEQYYLYVDDTEYTYRITEKLGTIWLIPSCRIVDIDKSHGIGYKNKILRSPLLDNWSFRTYYHVRNMIFFNKKAIKNIYFFKINKRLYLAGLFLISIWSGKKLEYKYLMEAINDGLKGNLGKKEFNNGRN